MCHGERHKAWAPAWRVSTEMTESCATIAGWHHTTMSFGLVKACASVTVAPCDAAARSNAARRKPEGMRGSSRVLVGLSYVRWKEMWRRTEHIQLEVSRAQTRMGVRACVSACVCVRECVRVCVCVCACDEQHTSEQPCWCGKATGFDTARTLVRIPGRCAHALPSQPSGQC